MSAYAGYTVYKCSQCEDGYFGLELYEDNTYTVYRCRFCKRKSGALRTFSLNLSRIPLKYLTRMEITEEQ